MSKTLTKQPAESRLYTMDFSANLASGETISAVVSVVAAPSSDITVGAGAATTDGKKVEFRISGGLDGAIHKITATVTTTGGNTLEGDGTLLVKQL